MRNREGNNNSNNKEDWMSNAGKNAYDPTSNMLRCMMNKKYNNFVKNNNK